MACQSPRNARRWHTAARLSPVTSPLRCRRMCMCRVHLGLARMALTWEIGGPQCDLARPPEPQTQDSVDLIPPIVVMSNNGHYCTDPSSHDIQSQAQIISFSGNDGLLTPSLPSICTSAAIRNNEPFSLGSMMLHLRKPVIQPPNNRHTEC
ncbi:hypothetical protein BD626DRAFT_59517 [Schizophyllum amplum]|uniref:Uncharacterized protein n=1 Tax=Schizophyllum amplum TaxID=97359 RepID=A0A550CBY3_9AGAR|nr:hypothetical protein BD626DRAFT_59517 [Auriculariopsis ampla]